jgi:hypothetical protein
VVWVLGVSCCDGHEIVRIDENSPFLHEPKRPFSATDLNSPLVLVFKASFNSF